MINLISLVTFKSYDSSESRFFLHFKWGKGICRFCHQYFFLL